MGFKRINFLVCILKILFDCGVAAPSSPVPYVVLNMSVGCVVSALEPMFGTCPDTMYKKFGQFLQFLSILVDFNQIQSMTSNLVDFDFFGRIHQFQHFRPISIDFGQFRSISSISVISHFGQYRSIRSIFVIFIHVKFR